MTEPWLRALRYTLDDLTVADLCVEDVLGNNPNEDYEPFKAALSRMEDISNASFSFGVNAYVPGLPYLLAAQPLRDSEGRPHCYYLEVTPQPDIGHMAMLEAMQAEIVGHSVGLTDPSALPLVAAASQGSPLPRNFLVRKVLEEAASQQGGAAGGRQGSSCMSNDAQMQLSQQLLHEIDHLDGAEGMDVLLGDQGEGEMRFSGGERRKGDGSVSRRVTIDSTDGGSSNDGSNSADGSHSSSNNTQLHSVNSSSSTSPSHTSRHAGRREGSSVAGSNSDDGSGCDGSDADVVGSLRHPFGKPLHAIANRALHAQALAARGHGRISEAGEAMMDDVSEIGSEYELRDETGAPLDRESILQTLLNF